MLVCLKGSVSLPTGKTCMPALIVELGPAFSHWRADDTWLSHQNLFPKESFGGLFKVFIAKPYIILDLLSSLISVNSVAFQRVAEWYFLISNIHLKMLGLPSYNSPK
jgi:hypothetical protein